MPVLSRISKAARSLIIPVALWTLLSGSSFFASCSTSTDDDDGFRFINRAPVASSSAFVTAINVPVSGFLQARDDDGDRLRFRIVSAPRIGFVEITDSFSGAFTYVSNSLGSDSFAFRADDGLEDSNSAIVSITISRNAVAFARVQTSNEQNEAHALLNASAIESTATAQARSERQVSQADPFNPAHWLAFTESRGLQQSVDAGNSWETLEMSAFFGDGGGVSAIAFNQFTPGLVYIALDKQAGGSRLIRSIDSGATWQLISDSVEGSIIELASGPLQADGAVVLYARIASEQGFFRAIDYPP